MKTIRDIISGEDVSIRIIGNSLTMTCNGAWIEAYVKGVDLSMAKVAYTKRDLDAFGSFFELRFARQAA